MKQKLIEQSKNKGMTFIYSKTEIMMYEIYKSKNFEK